MPRSPVSVAGFLCVFALTGCGSTAQQPGMSRGPEVTGPVPAGNGLGDTRAQAPDGTTGGAIGPGISSGLVVAPQGSTTKAAGTAGGTSGARASSATGKVRTQDTRPVKVGIIYVNNDQGAASAGIDNGNTFTPRRVFEGMVKAYNARGGLGGRKAEPTYVELRSSSTSLSADLEAACSRFVQDVKVAVVLSTIGLYSESFSACLTRGGIPQVAGDYALGDEESMKRAPTLYAPSTLTTDGRMRLLLEQMVAAKRLGPDDRLGVVVEGCSFDLRTYDRTVAPTAKRLGLTIASRADGRCFQSIGDLGGLTSDMQAAVLRFQSDRVNKVLFVSGSVEGNFMLFFATAAESQGYRPGYALTSAAVPAVQEANTPKPQLANAAGLGWIPSIDTTRAPPLLPASKRCLADLREGAGVAPNGPADRYYAFSVCSSVALYDAALKATLGAADKEAIGAAVAQFGTSFLGAAVVSERTDFRNGRRTGPAQGRVFAWGSCGCFEYVGANFPLTS